MTNFFHPSSWTKAMPRSMCFACCIPCPWFAVFRYHPQPVSNDSSVCRKCPGGISSFHDDLDLLSLENHTREFSTRQRKRYSESGFAGKGPLVTFTAGPSTFCSILSQKPKTV